MNEKPHFGTHEIKSESTEKLSRNEKPATKPSFGTITSAPENGSENQNKFGTTDQVPRAQQSGVHWLFGIFKLQSVSFWILNYIVAIVAFIFFNSANNFWIAIIDLILYPVTVTVCHEALSIMKIKPSILTSLVDGTNGSQFLSDSVLAIIIYWIVWVVILGIRFAFSFILGPIGIIYMISQVKKMEI